MSDAEFLALLRQTQGKGKPLVQVFDDEILIQDRHGRVLSMYLLPKTGEFMLSVPSGTPGTVRRVASLDRDEAREVAKGILAILGEQDQ